MPIAERCITLTLPGQPVAKGRARAHLRRGEIRMHTPEATAQAEAAWRAAFLASGQAPFAAGTPLCLEVRFYLERPRSARRRLWPATKPDLSNLVKLVEDALNGLAYHDDAAVVVISAMKCYAETPEAVRTEIILQEATCLSQ